MGLKNKNSSTNVDRPAAVENSRHCGKAGRSEGAKNVQKTAKIEQKRHECPFCEHTTLYKGNLKVHQLVHLKRHNSYCVGCGHGFREESDKNAHDKECEERRYACYLCKPYKNKKDLEQPESTFVTKNNKGLKRQKGTFETKDKRDLERHMLRHTGKKEICCEICKKRFARKSYIKIHMKKVHNRANR